MMVSAMRMATLWAFGAALPPPICSLILKTQVVGSSNTRIRRAVPSKEVSALYATASDKDEGGTKHIDKPQRRTNPVVKFFDKLMKLKQRAARNASSLSDGAVTYLSTVQNKTQLLKDKQQTDGPSGKKNEVKDICDHVVEFFENLFKPESPSFPLKTDGSSPVAKKRITKTVSDDSAVPSDADEVSPKSTRRKPPKSNGSSVVGQLFQLFNRNATAPSSSPNATSTANIAPKHHGTSVVLQFFQRLLHQKTIKTASPSSQSNITTTAKAPKIRVFFQRLLPRFATTTDASTSSAHNATSSGKAQKNHGATGVVLQFFRRLLNRNSTIPASSTSVQNATASTREAPKNFGTGALFPFLQRLFNPSTTTETCPPSKVNVTSTVPGLLQYSWDSPTNKFRQPIGSRWAIPSKDTDLSGKWKPIVSSEFKKQYDEYLQNCSQSVLFRNLCLNFVGMTREEIKQNGNLLKIRGTNPVGVWERMLVSSGSDLQNDKYKPFNVTFLDPDKDAVKVEAWWTRNGTVHKSLLRGKPRGGEFESTRYLEDDNNVLVCESAFHPNGAKGFQPAFVKWRFEREK